MMKYLLYVLLTWPLQAPRIGLAPGTYRTAFRRFKRADISHLKRTVKSSPASLKARRSLPLLAGCWAACCLPASGGRLRFRLGGQQLRLLSLGKMPYNADEPLHYSLMQAVSAGFAAAGGFSCLSNKIVGDMGALSPRLV